MGSKRIAVIGGGASGLTSIKACLEEGLRVTCFEMQGNVGGLWRYHDEDEEDLPSVMASTVINTSKEMSAFSDFPPPADFPNHMHNSKMIRYIEMYAEKFNLLKHVVFRQQVRSVNQNEDYDSTGRLLLRINNLDTNEERQEVYDGVMVCTGHHTFPNIPDIEGSGDFKGKIIHSHSYKRPTGFEKKKVVVVGIGNSGADVAAELSSIAQKVYLSTRRGAWILPLIGPGGYPNDAHFNRRTYNVIRPIMPNFAHSRFMEFIISRRFNHNMYNLKPKHGFMQQHPTIHDVLPTKIMNGTVVIKNDIDHLTPNGIVFVGEEEIEYECDTVVLATGYLIKFPFLSQEIFNPKDNECRLYKLVFPCHLKHPSLGFIALAQVLGCIFPISENQARWYAQVMSGKVRLPSQEKMEKDVECYQKKTTKRFYSSLRHTVQVDFIPFMEEIASQYGAKPNLFKMAFKDPRLFWACFTGPCLPYQFRIAGPGAWDGARDAILTYDKRVRAPFNTRIRRNNDNRFKLINREATLKIDG